MTKEELNKWYKLRKEYFTKGLSKWDLTELIRLNHLVMELTHDLHNKNMLNSL